MAPSSERSTRRSALAVLIATALAACSPANVGSPSVDGGKQGGADAGGDGAVGAMKACADWAQQRCARGQQCSTTWMQTHYGDVATCVSASTEVCLGHVAAPSGGGTPETYEACSQLMSGWACDDFIDALDPPPACAVMAGRLPAGAACGINPQCQSLYCSVRPGERCGTCGTQPALGAPCSQLADCGVGMFCASATLTCTAYVATGGPCDDNHSCRAGQNCITAAGMTSGTCQTAATTQGATCGPGTGNCDFWAGLECNSLKAECQQVQLGASGSLCGIINYQFAGCVAGDCAGNTPVLPGTCVGFAPTGGACDLKMGPSCFAEHRCIVGAGGGTRGTCQAPDATSCH